MGICHTFEFYNFNRKVLLAYTEYLEVTENRFFSFGVTVNAHTEKIALILPIQTTLKGDKSARRSDQGHQALHALTSETLNKFFWRRTVRPGKLSSVTRAGWFATSGVQYASMFSVGFLDAFAA